MPLKSRCLVTSTAPLGWPRQNEIGHEVPITNTLANPEILDAPGRSSLRFGWKVGRWDAEVGIPSNRSALYTASRATDLREIRVHRRPHNIPAS